MWARGLGGERVWALDDYRHVAGSFERPEYVLAIALDPAGRILFVHSDGPTVGRLGADGHIDHRVTVPMDWMTSLAATPDGEVVAAGSLNDAGAIVRLTPAGALDPASGTGGVGTFPAGGPVPAALALAPGGGVAVAGVASVGTENAFWAARMDAAGRPDPRFGSTSGVTTLLGTGDESSGRDGHVRALAIAPRRLTRVTVELRRGTTVIASRRLASLPAGRPMTVKLTLRRAARLLGLTLRVSAIDFLRRGRIR